MNGPRLESLFLNHYKLEHYFNFILLILNTIIRRKENEIYNVSKPKVVLHFKKIVLLNRYTN